MFSQLQARFSKRRSLYQKMQSSEMVHFQPTIPDYDGKFVNQRDNYMSIAPGRFFQSFIYDQIIREHFKMAYLNFEDNTQFASIYVGMNSSRNDIPEQTMIREGVKKYCLKVYQMDLQLPTKNDYDVIAYREISKYVLIKHENICKFYGAITLSTKFYSQGCYCIKLEYLETSLDSLQELYPYRSKENTMRMITHIGRAINYLHELGFAHHDIDLKSIRIKSINGPSLEHALLNTVVYKLCNFGLTELYDVDPNVEPAVETKVIRTSDPYFTAPEKKVTPLVPYDPFKSDMYSFGVVAMAMLLGKSQVETDLARQNLPFAKLLNYYWQKELVNAEVATFFYRTVNSDPNERLERKEMMDIIKKF